MGGHIGSVSEQLPPADVRTRIIAAGLAAETAVLARKKHAAAERPEPEDPELVIQRLQREISRLEGEVHAYAHQVRMLESVVEPPRKSNPIVMLIALGILGPILVYGIPILLLIVIALFKLTFG